MTTAFFQDGGQAAVDTLALGLAVIIDGVDLEDLDTEQLLDSLADLGFGGRGGNGESVLAEGCVSRCSFR